MNKKLLRFVLWYIPVLVVQLAGSWVTFTSVNTWYRSLHKAPWNPPDWVFGPAWTLLYLAMAWAVSLVSLSSASAREKRTAYALFFAQLFFNGLWSFLFFGLHSPFLALIDLVILLFIVAAACRVFFWIHKGAGLLLVPYLLWLVYALSLNIACVVLN